MHARVLIPVKPNRLLLSEQMSSRFLASGIVCCLLTGCQSWVLVCMRQGCVLHEHNSTVSHCKNKNRQSATYKRTIAY